MTQMPQADHSLMTGIELMVCGAWKEPWTAISWQRGGDGEANSSCPFLLLQPSTAGLPGAGSSLQPCHEQTPISPLSL